MVTIGFCRGSLAVLKYSELAFRTDIAVSKIVGTLYRIDLQSFEDLLNSE